MTSLPSHLKLAALGLGAVAAVPWRTGDARAIVAPEVASASDPQRAADAVDPRLAAHASALRAAANGFCRGSAELDDLVQDTFERALRFLAAGNPTPQHLRAWLISIMRNVFIDRVRSSKTFEPIEDYVAPDAPAEITSDRYTMADVETALAELDADQRAVFELHYLRGMRYADIATTLGIPGNTVASRLYRARKALRDVLLARAPETT